MPSDDELMRLWLLGEPFEGVAPPVSFGTGSVVGLVTGSIVGIAGSITATIPTGTIVGAVLQAGSSVSLASGAEVLTITGSITSLATGAFATVELGLGAYASPIHDAFNRLRVSDPQTLFESQMLYNEAPLVWYTETSGSASWAHSQMGACVDMTVSANNDYISRQTKQFFRYQPGKSQLILATFVGETTAEDVTWRVGYFARSNGIFLEVRASTPAFVVRSEVSSTVVDTRVEQSSWNRDTLDGSGGPNNPSGINLDLNKAQILFIDLEWLGVGCVRCGFVIDGKIVVAHQFNHANIVTSAYMTTANRPVRYEIGASSGTVSAHSLKQICCSVVSEGGFAEEFGIPFSAGNGATQVPVTTRRPIASIRPQLTFNGRLNRALIVPEEIAVWSETKAIYWELVYGGVLTSGSFAAVDGNSVTEIDTSATAITGGVRIDSGYVAAGGLGSSARSGEGGGRILSKLPLTLTPFGQHPTGTPSDILSVVATSLDTVTDCLAALSWRELR